MFFKTCYSNTEHILHKIWRKHRSQVTAGQRKKEKGSPCLTEGQALSHRTPRRPWPLSDHSPQASLPTPTPTEGRRQSASEEGKGVHCQLTQMDTCTCGIHVVNFSHAVCLPQNLSAGQKAETSNQQEKNEWQPLSFNPSNSLLTATHVPGAQTREAGGRRKKTEGGRCSSTEVQGSAGPAQPWEQTDWPAHRPPRPRLAQGSVQALKAADLMPSPHPAPSRPLDSGWVTGPPRPRFCICEAGILVPWGTTLTG